MKSVVTSWIRHERTELDRVQKIVSRQMINEGIFSDYFENLTKRGSHTIRPIAPYREDVWFLQQTRNKRTFSSKRECEEDKERRKIILNSHEIASAVRFKNADGIPSM